MNISEIKDKIPGYAKDLKLNLSSVLTVQGAPGLSDIQIAATALASAIAARNTLFTRELEAAIGAGLDEASLTAAKAAAAIMGMNNVYYRFLHLADDQDYANMPARLRMNVIGSPGVDKADFELYSLAVSAVNGCGLCITAHEKELRKAGVSKEAIQSAVRIASVIHAVANVLEYEQADSEARKAA